MSNGTVPLDLLSSDFDTISKGSCVTSGQYEGCIEVSGIFYWIERGASSWTLNIGLPDQGQVSITSEVWDKCKDGGSMSYDGTEGGWYDDGDLLKWNGSGGGDVSLEQIE